MPGWRHAPAKRTSASASARRGRERIMQRSRGGRADGGREPPRRPHRHTKNDPTRTRTEFPGANGPGQPRRRAFLLARSNSSTPSWGVGHSTCGPDHPNPASRPSHPFGQPSTSKPAPRRPRHFSRNPHHQPHRSPTTTFQTVVAHPITPQTTPAHYQAEHAPAPTPAHRTTAPSSAAPTRTAWRGALCLSSIESGS